MSVLSTVKANELNVSEYIGSLNLNPSNVYYARYKSTNISPSNAQWSIQSPNTNNLLLSYAQIQWKPKYIVVETATNNGTDYNAAEQKWGLPGNPQIPYISFKGILPFANAMTSITTTINGTVQSLAQPTNFMEQLCAMCVTKEEARKCFENGYHEDSGGLWPGGFAGFGGVGNLAKALKIDEGLMANEYSWHQKALNQGTRVEQNRAFDNTWPAVGGAEMIYTEAVIAPPFNPFAKVQSSIPNYLPWKNMSEVIPHIDKLELDIQFTKLAESIWLNRYMKSSTAQKNSRLNIVSLEADLYLYWYEVPHDSIAEVPRTINIQSWMVREFQTSTNLTALLDGAPADVDSQLIQLRSVPSFMIISCRRDKNGVSYDGTNFVRDDNQLGVNGVYQNRNTLDYYCRFTKLESILADRPLVISSSFTNAELYYLTVKNSKYPYPYSQNEWLGKSVPVYGAAADATTIPVQEAGTDWRRQMSHMAVTLRPKDLAEKMSDGVFSPVTVQYRTSVQARHGFAGGISAGAHAYRLFVHVFDTKSFLHLERDKAQFQLQSISMQAAAAALRPSSTLEGGSLRVGGGTRPLDALRERGIDRYVPRVF